MQVREGQGIYFRSYTDPETTKCPVWPAGNVWVCLEQRRVMVEAARVANSYSSTSRDVYGLHIQNYYLMPL